MPSGLSLQSVGSMGARILAILAIACALVGPALAVRHRQTGRHVGISLFLLFWPLVSWLLDLARGRKGAAKAE